MSLESLLLVAFLIVIPLLERLVRVLRERICQSPADPAPVPAPRRPPPMPRPTVPENAPDPIGESGWTARPVDIAVPPPPVPRSLEPRHRAAERLTSRERARAHRGRRDLPAAPVVIARTPDVGRRMTSLRGIRLNLRQSIALMAVLGPCKALDNDIGRG